MSAGATELLMGLMSPSTDETVPSVGEDETYNTGFTGKLYDGTEYSGIRELPTDSKYYDMYAYGDNMTDYTRGKIGDVTAEMQPSNERTWNSNVSTFPCSRYPLFVRGMPYTHGVSSGVFAFHGSSCHDLSLLGFRAVLVEN